MTARPEGLLLDPQALLPDAWRSIAGAGPVRMFNPGLLADGNTLLVAYRVVAPDGLRRIAIARLERSTLRVVAGSASPLSDGFRLRSGVDYPVEARTWFADPRLYRFGARLFVYWNSGWHEPRNYQFIHELHSTTLEPIGTARELILRHGDRQKLEKNWTLFVDASGDLRAVYAVAPHRVLGFSLEGEGDIFFDDVATTRWALDGYPASHGGLRGGTPPHWTPGGFVSFCHSVHDGATGYRYAASAYRFADKAPYSPSAGPRGWLPLYNPHGETRTHPALNTAVAEVLYPCGAVHDGDRWLVSHGVNDEHCAITVLSDAQIEAALAPRLG